MGKTEEHSSPAAISGDVAARAAARRISPNSTGTKVKRLAWSVVQGTLYRWSFPTWSRWRIALLRLFGAKVGNRCTVRRTSVVYYPWQFAMGDLSCLGDRCEIYNLAQVTLGARVTISQDAYLCAGTHDYTVPAMPLVTRPISVGRDAWICARAFVYPGVKVGDGAVVAACAVVVKDVAAWTVVGGNPAKFIKQRVSADAHFDTGDSE